jgi:hypothetical protein
MHSSSQAARPDARWSSSLQMPLSHRLGSPHAPVSSQIEKSSPPGAPCSSTHAVSPGKQSPPQKISRRDSVVRGTSRQASPSGQLAIVVQ